MQRTDAASKKQMLAYLLASLAKCMAMTLLFSRAWEPASGMQKTHAWRLPRSLACKERMLAPY